MVKFKDFSRPLSVFQVLFNANLIFKDFSRQSCIFKYFSSLCKPCITKFILLLLFNPFMNNGISCPYKFDKSISNLRAAG